MQYDTSTLTGCLFDQCNLDDSCSQSLFQLEQNLFERLSHQSLSKDGCVAIVKAFCRKNSGTGFYDVSGSSQLVIEAWWEAMDNFIKMEDLEETYQIHTPSPDIIRLEQAAMEINNITNGLKTKLDSR